MKFWKPLHVSIHILKLLLLLLRTTSTSTSTRTTVTVSTPTIPNRAQLSKNTAGTYFVESGVMKYAFPLLETHLNVSIHIKPSSGGQAGNFLKNGTWTGVIGDLVGGRADFGIVTAITYSRWSVIDFSNLVEFQDLAFLIHKPSRIYSAKSVVQTFEPWLWAALLSIFCGVWLSLYFLDYGFLKGGFFTLSLLLEQSRAIPRTLRFRSVCALWLLLIVNVSCLYKSRYFTMLTFPLTETVPRTYENLARSSYRVGLHFLGGAAFHFIRTSKTPAFLRITKRLELVMKADECFESVRTNRDQYACVGWRGILEYYVQTRYNGGSHPFILVPDSAFMTPLAFSFPKHSPWKPRVNKFVGGAVEGGFMKIWTLWDVNEGRNGRGFKDRRAHRKEQEKVRKLDLRMCKGPMLLWVCGILMALGVAGAEVTLARVFKVSKVKL